MECVCIDFANPASITLPACGASFPSAAGSHVIQGWPIRLFHFPNHSDLFVQQSTRGSSLTNHSLCRHSSEALFWSCSHQQGRDSLRMKPTYKTREPRSTEKSRLFAIRCTPGSLVCGLSESGLLDYVDWYIPF